MILRAAVLRNQIHVKVSFASWYSVTLLPSFLFRESSKWLVSNSIHLNVETRNLNGIFKGCC